MAAHASTEQPPPPTKAASVGGSVARRTALASYATQNRPMAAALRRHLGGGRLQAQEMTAAELWPATVTPIWLPQALQPGQVGSLRSARSLAAERYQLVSPRQARAAQTAQQERGRAEARAHLQPGL